MALKANTTVETTKQALLLSGLNVIAHVEESPGVVDLAVAVGPGAFVVRCLETASQTDYHALKTMLSQGDFTRAAIVYTAEDQPYLSGEIETYPLSRIDELAASLARESDP
jgi:hypothetical protein